MKLIYQTLNIVSIFCIVLGIVAGVAIKLKVPDIPQINGFSSIIALEYSGMLFVSGGIFFSLKKFLQMLEEYLKDNE